MQFSNESSEKTYCSPHMMLIKWFQCSYLHSPIVHVFAKFTLSSLWNCEAYTSEHYAVRDFALQKLLKSIGISDFILLIMVDA